MFGLICTIVFVLAGLVFIGTSRKVAEEMDYPRGLVAGLGVVLVLIGGVVLFFSSTTKVEQRHYGIEVGYGGKATGRATGAGLQWHKPWDSFETWDATRQTFNTLKASCEAPGNGDLWVTIAGQGNACVRVQIEWQTSGDKEQASKNWSAYKPVEDKTRFDVFYERRIAPSFVDAVQDTFRTFDPMTAVDKETGAAVAPDIDAYKGPLKAALVERVGTDVEIVSISFATIGYDKPTSDSIAAYGQKVRDKRNLLVDKGNAELRETIAKDSGLTPFESACLATNRGEPGLCADARNKVTVTRSVDTK